MAISTPSPYRRILVKGVRARPGGRVGLWSLRDGWVVFRDLDLAHRRWTAVALTAAVVLLGVAPPLVKYDRGVGTAVGVAAVAVLAVVWPLDTCAQRRAWRIREQMRMDAIHRAGGLDSIKWGISMGGRYAQTVDEANILLTALGRNEPMISARSVTTATVQLRRFSASVDVALETGDTITYRVRGRSAPAQLAQLAQLVQHPLGAKCTTNAWESRLDGYVK